MNIQHSQALQNWVGNFTPGLFTSVMGIAGLGVAWRIGHSMMGLPSIIGEVIVALSLMLFAGLVVLFVLRFFFFYRDATDDFRQTARLMFLPAFPIAGLLVSIGIRPYDFDMATYMWCASAPFNLILAAVLVGRWLFDKQTISSMNPTWFFPIVGNAVVPIAGVPLGFQELSWLFLSVAMIFWAIVFIMLVFRLIFESPMPEKLTPTFTILIAPPATIFLAYYELTNGALDMFSRMMMYAALFIFIVLLPYAKRLLNAPASLALWSLTFPLDALTIATFKFSVSSQFPIFEIIAQILLGVTTMTVCWVICRSLNLLRTRLKNSEAVSGLKSL